MRILETLVLESQARDLPFVVIGGHAVVAHGYSRQTFDLDLLVREQDRAAWRDVLAALGYRVFHEHPAFLQLTPPSPDQWPIDLMLVDEVTFAGLLAEAQDADFGTVQAKVPSLTHLIALKLHVLKDAAPARAVTDLADIVRLVDVNGLDVRADDFRRLCEKYGSMALYERIVQALGRS